MRRVSHLTGIPPATLEGVATFYAQFRHRPMGKHHVKVCDGTACHIQGSERVHEAMQEHLGVGEGTDTDADGLFTVEKVFCVGCCTLAPVVQIDGESHAHLSRETAPALLESFLRKPKPKRRVKPGRIVTPEESAGEIRICLDSCCVARGCGRTHDALQAAVASGKLSATIKQVGCVVMCDRSPLVEVALKGEGEREFSAVKPEQVSRLLGTQFSGGGVIPWLSKGARAALDWLSGEEVDEVILALSATVDGQSTAHYIADHISSGAIEITHLAHGVPVGGELDYLDDGTITTALKSRKASAS